MNAAKTEMTQEILDVLPKAVADAAVLGIIKEVRWYTGDPGPVGNTHHTLDDWSVTPLHRASSQYGVRQEAGWTYLDSWHESRHCDERLRRDVTVRGRLILDSDEFGEPVLYAEWEIVNIGKDGVIVATPDLSGQIAAGYEDSGIFIR